MIDEDPEQALTVEWFFYYLDLDKSKYEFKHINPNWLSIPDAISQIYEEEIDFLMIDLKLTDGSTQCRFNWDELIKAINIVNPELPKVIITNNPEDSLNWAIENAFISKREVRTDNVELFNAITNSIASYRKNINDANDNLNTLRWRLESGTLLTPSQERELYELEDRIGRIIWEGRLSMSVMNRVDINRLWTLIEQTSKILEK